MSVTRFRRLAFTTVLAVYALIAVGGIVRASGSGMGCPDWPKCFGRWVPPTAESQLPSNYQELYAGHGYAEARFNAFKTWTEYVNRLIGVVIGLLIFSVGLASLRFWSADRAVVGWSFGAVVLVGFQGWLGSVVVASNLAPWIVTLHMIVALILVGMLIYVVARADRASLTGEKPNRSPWLSSLLLVNLALSATQIVLGTQVREQIDRIAERTAERSQWIGELGALLGVHRSFSLLVLAASLLLVLALRRGGPSHRTLDALGFGVVGIVATEILIGAVLYYFNVPAWLQPFHLLLAALLAGVHFALWIVYREATAPPHRGFAATARELSGA